MQSMVLLVLICVTGFLVTGQNYACNGPIVNDIERRSRNYIASDSAGDPYISDEYLTPGWYSVNERIIPDSSNKPNITRCGTKNPIYIKGKHPTKEQLSNGTMLSVTACELFPWEDCENEIVIDVILCRGLFHYYLKQTSKNSAYCFDPPDIQNVTVFDPAPTNIQFGILSVKPKLRFELKSGYLVPYNEYECRESGSYNRTGLDLLYSTYWSTFRSVNSRKLVAAFERREEITSLRDADLIYAGLAFGVNIECGVRVSLSIHGLQTDMVSSAEFFIGIKFSETVINLPANGSANITMTPTIPFGCYAKINDKRDGKTGECSMRVKIIFQSGECALNSMNAGSPLILDVVQARCGTEINGFYPFDISDGSDLVMKSSSFYVTSVYFSKSDATNHQVSFMTSSTGSHAIWKTQTFGSVWVNTITDPGFKENEDNTCYARVDPHMMTSDGVTFEHQVGGEFILYKHDAYPIEVQERTTQCNNNQAYCTCAVGIRAGGDVFLINLCGGLKEIGMTSCKDGGSLTIQKYNEYEYQIYTNIGTMVVVKIHSGNYKKLMDVKIHMVPKDFKKTKGLCGIFDGNKDNDYHDREGNKVSLDDFREYWRIKFEDTNLLKPGCSIPVDNWEDSVNSLFCLCNCTLTNAASANEPVACPVDDHTAICSTSQYINCTVDHDVTSTLCKEFNQKCNAGSKRSVSYYNRHIEQARRAKLAENESKTIFKRTSRETVSISYETAMDLCRQKVTHFMSSNMTNLLMGVNITKIIEECSFDVFIGQDAGWIEPAVVMLKDAVKTGYKRNANYTITHQQDYAEFMPTTCPMNCSENGKCNSKGQCECDYGWFGPDCLNDVKEGPVIEDVEADGLCDQIYGSECRCFYVQTNVLATNFSCKMQMRKRYLNGVTQTLTNETGYGEYLNIFNGRCCFEKRSRRSLLDNSNNTAELYINEIEVSLTNDGVNFGPQSTITIYDSSCINISKINQTVFFNLKINTCQINGICYEDGFSANDACFKCKPLESQFTWSYDCSGEKSTERSDHRNVIIIAVCLGIPGIILIICVCIFLYKKYNTTKTAASPNGVDSITTVNKSPLSVSEFDTDVSNEDTIDDDLCAKITKNFSVDSTKVTIVKNNRLSISEIDTDVFHKDTTIVTDDEHCAKNTKN